VSALAGRRQNNAMLSFLREASTTGSAGAASALPAISSVPFCAASAALGAVGAFVINCRIAT